MNNTPLAFFIILIIFAGIAAATGITAITSPKQTPPQGNGPVKLNATESMQFKAYNPPTETPKPSDTPVVYPTYPPGGSPAPTPPNTNTLASWPVFNFDSFRSGNNTAEKTLTSQTVTNMKQLWKVALMQTADSSPVAQSNVLTSSGTKDLLFLTTLNGTTIALNAADGTIIWQKGGIGGGSKITNSSPAVDPSGQYVYGYDLDGKVHKYASGTGIEYTANGWPQVVTNMPNAEKESSALNIGNGYLYVTLSGYIGDANHYEGHVDAINLNSGTKTVWNSLCANIHQQLTLNSCGLVQSGIWARAGAEVDPINNTVYVVTGNGAYDANAGGNDYGDSVIALTPSLSQVVDTYTPVNYDSLQANDADLGSTDPVFIPRQTTGNFQYLALQGGKDNKLRLLNRQNLSGKGAPNNVGGELQTLNYGCEIFSQPIAWNDSTGISWVFVSSGCGLQAFKVLNGKLQNVYQGTGGSSPIIAGNVLYVQSSSQVRALDPITGNTLWSGSVQGLHWESPIVFNGKLIVPDNSGHITAFGL